eukprot:Unigene5768_Nuclearia_a/m.17629 Unigene5768_Nuclearia_a/g.17629  ORF Unigene5768_Nuclearia_a/g.17629 Unigene5768_Nuclearia_a/m.17629 type:complete len:704 (-) Unigene5768_Nuclearia_a:44-2155(-)
MTVNGPSASARVARLAAHVAVGVAPAPCFAPAPSPGVALAEERARASFPVRELTHLLDGGAEWTAVKEKIMLEIERDPVFNNEDRHDLTRPQARERTMAKVAGLIPHILSDGEAISRVRFDVLSLVDPGFMTRIGVHFGLFFGTVRSQASSEQMGKLVEMGMFSLKGMYGCFAMTELGHGSNVAGLETTATFDPRSDEFVIHTPTLTATKWWIGGAAHSATHAVVFAQLIVDGKKYGVKPFIVQLRNPSDYSLRPGITIGDCGAKMGRHGIDNGWIQFTYVRINREWMLSRHTQVGADGTVHQPKLQQLAYGALIGGRVQMVMDSANIAKLALTIAVRYGCVRRQFAFKEGEPEKQIINYASHQYRLMPLLALTYAMHFGGMETNKQYLALMERLDTAGPDDPDSKDIVNELKAVHATSAGLKAFSTWSTLDLIEQCRQALGGHGYSSYAGLASLYADFAVQCSWEGDNTIMMLQNGRFLINCYREAKRGITQPPVVGYLNMVNALKGRHSGVTDRESLLNLRNLVEIFDIVCAQLANAAGEQFERLVARGVEAEVAYEEGAVSLLACARAHCYSILLRRFVDAISVAHPAVVKSLTQVCLLYALYTIQERLGTFALQYTVLSPAQFDLVRQEVFEMCKLVRNDCVPLTDAFNYTDFVVGSPLGRFDGDIYRHYFHTVTHAPGATGVPLYFESTIKRLFTRPE